MSFFRRLVGVGAAVMLITTLSGCVVRPLWWGDHDRHDHEHYGYHSEPRDGGRQDDWRQNR
ncbi:hypothetical protein [Rhodoferax sp. GW822-FHT02A01]|uniref:hypothetical protein n=1 Tax=Rhodoferax sp. GW822-FHT02A01 TaxID=3141537 RepID=UPI00315CCCD5